MPLKITLLSQAFPGVDHSANSRRCHRLVNAGVEFLHGCAALSAGRDTYGYNLSVELPLMHQAIELLLKAHAARIDDTFSPKAYNHKTTKLLQDYSSRIPIFSTLVGDSQCTQLIAALEQSWLSVRYGEAVAEFSGPDYNAAGNIANLLVDEYFRVYGVPLQAHHFAVLQQHRKESEA